jgi:hypothetical protein
MLNTGEEIEDRRQINILINVVQQRIKFAAHMDMAVKTSAP